MMSIQLLLVMIAILMAYTPTLSRLLFNYDREAFRLFAIATVILFTSGLIWMTAAGLHNKFTTDPNPEGVHLGLSGWEKGEPW